MDTALINYTLHLADNALILGHRNSEWCGHGPILEQDIAVSNIALDYIGQARNFYQYAATLINQLPADRQHQLLSFDAAEVTEDTLAYLRDVPAFKNLLITELPNGDWAQTTLRLFLFSTWQYYCYQQLQYSQDTQLAAIAAKALKEVTYHVKWSGEWVIRLGDGTEESKRRLLLAIEELADFTGEFFAMSEYEKALLPANIAVNLDSVKTAWTNKVTGVLEEATVALPPGKWFQSGGKQGIHTEHLGYILAEMQFLQRAYPNATW